MVTKVTTNVLADDAVQINNIADSAVTPDELAANAVETDKILSANVTEDKLATNSVSETKIVDGSVTENKVGALAVTEGKIGALAVTEGKIGAAAVTGTKIGAGAVDNTHLAANAVTTTAITDANVTLAKMAPDSVDASKISAGAVGTTELAALAVTDAKIADATITEGKLAFATVPVGTILIYAGGSVPTGFLLCYGQTLDSVANTEYADLYTAIGTTYGGTGAADFDLPDCRGRAAIGKDNMGGTSAERLTALTGGIDGDTLGATGGAQSHILMGTQTPDHYHFCVVPVANGQSTGPSATRHIVTLTSGQNNNDYTLRATDAQEPTVGPTSGVAGGGSDPFNIVQPSIIFNLMIKY